MGTMITLSMYGKTLHRANGEDLIPPTDENAPRIMSACPKASTIALAVASALLTGCLATTNLASDDAPISAIHRMQANTMLDMLHKHCVHVTGRDDAPAQTKVKIVDRGSVKRLYNSDSAWLKADVAAQGVWDTAYYNRRTGEFVCGQKDWDKRDDAAKYSFNEIQPLKTAPDWN